MSRAIASGLQSAVASCDRSVNGDLSGAEDEFLCSNDDTAQRLAEQLNSDHEAENRRLKEELEVARLKYVTQEQRANARAVQLAQAQARAASSIRDFVQRVNARAEAEMMRTGTLEGAHHRAIEAELDALPQPTEEVQG